MGAMRPHNQLLSLLHSPCSPGFLGAPSSSPGQLRRCTCSLCSKHLVWGRVSESTSTDLTTGTLA